MTEVEVYGANSGLAIPGLEGFDPGQVAIPRITIDHDNGIFKNNLDGSTFDTLNVVILGMVHQRVLWPKRMGDSDKPQCKARDAQWGYPNLEGDRKGLFPWSESNFTEENLQLDSNGNKVLPCKACSLKDWGGTRDDREPPRCSEQYTFVLQDEYAANYLYTVQRTGLKNARRFITGFIQRKTPMFTKWTKITVQTQGGTQRSYGVPVFALGSDTDQSMWEGWADEFKGIREFITKPPRGDGNDADGETNIQAATTSSTGANQYPAAAKEIVDAEVVQQPAAQPMHRPGKPGPAPVAADDDDDDLPF